MTNYRILQKGAARKGNAFGSFKYAGKSALRYKLGVDILAGNLVWVWGPYPAGKYTDIAIFNSVLTNCIKPGERVEADNGYVGRLDKIQCPNNDCNPVENRVMQEIARPRHETLNVWLNSLTAIRVLAGTKNSRPVEFYSRNTTKSTVNPNTTIPQI